MAVDDEERPWDDQTDQFISAIDAGLKDPKGQGLRDILTNPEKYPMNKEMLKQLDGMKDKVNAFFDAVMDGLKDDSAMLKARLESNDLLYRRIDDTIRSKAAAAKVPYVRPMLVEVGQDMREEITIEEYDEKLEGLIGKLVGGASYVADLSADYMGHKLGSWLFSGIKPYFITVNPPSGFVVLVEGSRTAIIQMLSDIRDRAKAYSA